MVSEKFKIIIVYSWKVNEQANVLVVNTGWNNVLIRKSGKNECRIIFCNKYRLASVHTVTHKNKLNFMCVLSGKITVNNISGKLYQ